MKISLLFSKWDVKGIVMCWCNFLCWALKIVSPIPNQTYKPSKTTDQRPKTHHNTTLKRFPIRRKKNKQSFPFLLCHEEFGHLYLPDSWSRERRPQGSSSSDQIWFYRWIWCTHFSGGRAAERWSWRKLQWWLLCMSLKVEGWRRDAKAAMSPLVSYRVCW